VDVAGRTGRSHARRTGVRPGHAGCGTELGFPAGLADAGRPARL